MASGISSLNSWKKRYVEYALMYSSLSNLTETNVLYCSYCMVLRTAERDVVEIDLFSMKPGEKRPPCPRYRLLLIIDYGEGNTMSNAECHACMLCVSLELVYRASDGIQDCEDGSWFNRRDFRFALNAYAKSGINRVSAPQSYDFAAANQAELVAWKGFLTGLRVRHL